MFVQEIMPSKTAMGACTLTAAAVISTVLLACTCTCPAASEGDRRAVAGEIT